MMTLRRDGVSGAAFLARYLDGIRTEHTYSNDEKPKIYGLMMETSF